MGIVRTNVDSAIGNNRCRMGLRPQLSFPQDKFLVLWIGNSRKTPLRRHLVTSPGLSPLRSIASEAPRRDRGQLAAQRDNENDGRSNSSRHHTSFRYPCTKVETPQRTPSQISDRYAETEAWLIPLRSLASRSPAVVEGSQNQSSRQRSRSGHGGSTFGMKKRFKNRFRILKDFDPTTMQRSSAYLSTQALYRFVEAPPVFHCAGSPAIEPSTRSFISKAGRGLLSFPKSEGLPA